MPHRDASCEACQFTIGRRGEAAQLLTFP